MLTVSPLFVCRGLSVRIAPTLFGTRPSALSALVNTWRLCATTRLIRTSGIAQTFARQARANLSIVLEDSLYFQARTVFASDAMLETRVQQIQLACLGRPGAVRASAPGLRAARTRNAGPVGRVCQGREKWRSARPRLTRIARSAQMAGTEPTASPARAAEGARRPKAKLQSAATRPTVFVGCASTW